MEIGIYEGKGHRVEYSIVNASELEGELRMDAEYYIPEYLRALYKINSKHNESFWKFVAIFESGKNLRQSLDGIPFIRTQNINDVLVDDTGLSYTKQTNVKRLRERDILFGRVGRAGECVIVTKDYEGSTFSDNVLRLRLRMNLLINPFYVVVFFNSEVGKLYFNHVIKGTSQPLISKENFKFLKIPIPSQTFQNFIEILVLRAHEERQRAKKLYKEAEDILLNEFGLKNWKPKTKKIKIGGVEFEEEKNISIRMLSEVLNADRLDAEYWEPKFEEIENMINNYPHGWDNLPNLTKISREKVNVDEDETYNYIELADVNPYLGVVNKTKILRGSELPSRARMKVNKGYVIMSSVKGSIEKIALIDSGEKNLVASTGFFVFKEKSNSLNNETLLILLKILARRYILREAQGTILTAIPYDSLQRIKIPRVPKRIQQKISRLIQQSFGARRTSSKLLEIAKRAVEIYIEKDEMDGLEYARKNISELGFDI